MNNYNIAIANEQVLYKIDEVKIHQQSKIMLDFALNFPNLPPVILNLFQDLKGKQVKTFNFDLVFCDNETIKDINYEYRGKDKPTDVITFSLFFDDENKLILDNQVHLGEIIISTEKTAQQAKERNKTFEEELLFLLSHGILHLLGLDHPDDKSLQSMLSIQENMVKEVRND